MQKLEILSISEVQRLAKQGDTEAMRKLAMAYMQGDGVCKDLDKGFEWILEAAERGNSEAMAEMADIYRSIQKFEKAFYWDEKAANQGRAMSMYNLSVHYRDGIGVSANKEKHHYWYEKGKQNGFPPSS